LLDPPADMYGKVMSIPDPLMLEFFDLLHGGMWEDLRDRRHAIGEADADPLAFKHELATRIVARFHGEEAARGAREHFQRVVQRKEVPDDVPESRLPLSEARGRGLLEVLETLGLAQSRSDARRLVSQGAVRVDGRRVEDPAVILEAGSYLIQIGKRRFTRLVLGDSQA
ncbi:MAG: S4 domain-containing protein, partial [bacterium]